MQINLADIPLQRLDDGTQVALCPNCDSGYPSFTVSRVDGELRGFCPLCRFSITEPIDEENKAEVPSIIEDEPSKKKHFQDPLVGVYSGWAGEFSKIMAQHTETPRSFYFMASLTCLGVLLSGRVTLASEISPQPRLYTVILGESADDRKSTAIKKTMEFFRDAVTDFPACHGVGSAEGLAEQFNEQNKVLLVFDEFRTFVSKAKIETSVLLQTVNSLFEDNRFHSATKKHRIKIDDAHLAILAASTVETYSNIFDSHFLDIGFVNRLFVIKDHGERRFALPSKIDEGEKKRLIKSLGELLKILADASNGGPVELALTPEARLLFEEWYFNLPKTQTAKRLDTYGHRLMILLAINDGKTQIDLETVNRTIKLLEYEYQTREEVDPIDADSKIAVMEEKIRRALRRGPKNQWGLKKAVHYERDGLFIFNTALKNLVQGKEVTFDRKEAIYSLEVQN